jgi:muramoyltetrapeptide carboxypeptidase
MNELSNHELNIRLSPKLRVGDSVRLVSPASTPDRAGVERSVRILESFGLKAEIAPHAFDEYGYLAGTDEDRLSDLNDALRDPHVKAIFATRGGKGAYRIADGIDFAAAIVHPKLLVGFSEITVLHMALLKHSGLAAVHGACWDAESFGEDTAASFQKTVFTDDPVTVTSNSKAATFELTTHGRVTGRLIGGNQDSIATAAGWALPSFEGAILLLEGENQRLGHIDRQLTMLMNACHLRGLKGVVVGQYTNCEPDGQTKGNWTVIDVLRDRLSKLGVPILGGLPIGHGDNPIAVPIGTMATLDTNTRTLQVQPAVH